MFMKSFSFFFFEQYIKSTRLQANSKICSEVYPPDHCTACFPQMFCCKPLSLSKFALLCTFKIISTWKSLVKSERSPVFL